MVFSNIFKLPLLVFFIISIITTILIYMTIVGANMTKTDREQYLEDEEQQKYLKDYYTRRKTSGKKNK